MRKLSNAPSLLVIGLIGISVIFSPAPPAADAASTTVVLNAANNHTDTLEPGATISDSPFGGRIAGTNVVFACGTCATADFVGAPSGISSICGYRTNAARLIIANDDQLCAKVVPSGALFDIDLLSRFTQRRGCIDADGGVSCAASGGATSYLRSEIDADGDGDGVNDDDDLCPDTVIPEGVPTVQLNPNHWALTDDDDPLDFDTVTKGKGKGPNRSYTIEDTAGCSCEQIIEIRELGDGHTYHGCSISAMDDWVELVSNPPDVHATCAELQFSGTIWGTPAVGVDLRARTNSTLHFIGCENNGCATSSFFCQDNPSAESLRFGVSSGGGTLRALIDPGNANGDDMTGGPLTCCSATNPDALCNAPDKAADAIALCNALGYASGSVISAPNNSCPEAEDLSTANDGSDWSSDFVASTGHGKEYTCTGFIGL